MADLLMNKEQVMAVIPHRDPMLLIDSVISMEEGKSICASFYLDPELPFFKGHFPGDPVMPGVLTVESMAQASDVLLMSLERYAGKIPLFIGIDGVKFRQKILPGDTITIKSEIQKENPRSAIITCAASVYKGDELTTEGLLSVAMR